MESAFVDGGGEPCRLAVDLDLQGAALLGRVEGDETKDVAEDERTGFENCDAVMGLELCVFVDCLAIDPQSAQGGASQGDFCPLKSTVMLMSARPSLAATDAKVGLSSLGRMEISSPLVKAVARAARRPLTKTSGSACQ